MLKLTIALVVISIGFRGIPAKDQDSELQDLVLKDAKVGFNGTDGSDSKEFFMVPLVQANWFAAQHLCSLYGMNLVSVQTEAENSYLQKYLKDFGLSGFQFWTSGNKLAGYNIWYWMSSGKPMSYTNWAPGEPNNFQRNEHCVEVKNNGKWNDNDCYYSRHFVCESRCTAELK